MVPATENSDLSPDFLRKLEDVHGVDYVMEYFDKNAIFQGERCKWLNNEDDGTTTCTIYEKRGSDCRNYPDPTTGSTYCKVGKIRMEGL
jgi:Fe-S-cluster containining protein